MPSGLRRWAQACTTDFAAIDAARAVAVLPLGATEQHGPHLPLSVDSDIAEGVIAAAAAHLPATVDAWVLPLLPVGLSPEHQRFAGTLTLSAETALRLWADTVASVARAGLRKLVVLNAHGGHAGFLEAAAREWRERHDLIVCSVHWYQLPLIGADGRDLLQALGPHEQRFGVHGGRLETSAMLALHPDRVRTAALQRFDSSAEARAQRYPVLGNGRSARLAWQMQDYNAQGAAGDAAAASADEGRALIEAAGRSLATLLAEVADLPLDTLRDRPA